MEKYNLTWNTHITSFTFFLRKSWVYYIWFTVLIEQHSGCMIFLWLSDEMATPKYSNKSNSIAFVDLEMFIVHIMIHDIILPSCLYYQIGVYGRNLNSNIFL